MSEAIVLLVGFGAMFPYAAWERAQWQKELRRRAMLRYMARLRMVGWKYAAGLNAMSLAMIAVGTTAVKAAQQWQEAMNKIGVMVNATDLEGTKASLEKLGTNE